jgi:hypothetical protein
MPKNILSTFDPADKELLILLVLSVLWIGMYFVWHSAISQPVVCTDETLQCPDGSYVGRSGPGCDFVCPGQ